MKTTMIKTTPTRTFTSADKNKLNILQEILEDLRSMEPSLPQGKKNELGFMLSLVTEHQNRVLDGEDISHDEKALFEITLVNNFRREFYGTGYYK